MDRYLVDIRPDDLPIGEVLDHLRTAEAGGIDLFVGTTRQWTDGRETAELAYECYEPMARRVIRRLLDEASARWPVARAAVLHRTGVVPVAAASVIIGVATPHRAAAFEACRHLIDRLKEEVPIWKREHFADGTSVWVEGTPTPGPEPN